MRSYHVAGSTVDEVIPIVKANVSHEAAVMTDAAQLYKYRLGDFASHDRVDHSKKEYVRYEEGRPAIHTNTVEGYFSVFKRGMRGTYQHCKEKHLHRYLAEFDFRYNNARSRLASRTSSARSALVKGAKGKRLTYRTARGARTRSRRSRGSAAVLSGRRSLSYFQPCIWVAARRRHPAAGDYRKGRSHAEASLFHNSDAVAW